MVPLSAHCKHYGRRRVAADMDQFGQRDGMRERMAVASSINAVLARMHEEERLTLLLILLPNVRSVLSHPAVRCLCWWVARHTTRRTLARRSRGSVEVRVLGWWPLWRRAISALWTLRWVRLCWRWVCRGRVRDLGIGLWRRCHVCGRGGLFVDHHGTALECLDIRAVGL